MVYPIGKRIVLQIAKLWIRKIIGIENVPKDKPFILAANHSSFLDDFAIVPILVNHLNKRVHMYCNDRFYKNKIMASFLRWASCIPVSIQTGNKETNKKAFELALKYLKKGEPVGIFPEGGRSHDGEMREAKTGIAKLALTAKVPILPIGIIGSHKVFPKGAKFPKFKRFEIKIGKPFYLEGNKDNKKALKEATTLIMKEIGKLIRKEYKH
ncbi:MAG: 1-acyl-sn-glycerol-3-phosphate acyltransferase [Nanoarchaeota archaeon]|nr:1-acyl-sn-glycerol-3-phosphate acyltransferase [Nanoarchaeota archaeon]MBU1005057.1 1-acyl-sn-glycerol-3-phosphate acyltransferase [Nanoarchaeota archaeon]MBU1945707.1 1-acyl-sn-glycerol-3-phosphate acyltransferase [Nanoarchaeota archaeon]